MPQPSDLPRVRILATGGTIASTADERTGAMRAATSGAELIEAVPALTEVAAVEVEEVALVNSWDVDLPMMAGLARRVEAAQTDGAAGVVITHGTDTLEETAFALDLLLDVGIPVVVTGAMRGGGGADSDGPRNLLSAARVAVADEARGVGCVTVLADEVHAARWVHKTHTTALHTFASPGVGPMGSVDDDGVFLRWRPSPRPGLRAADGAIPDPAAPIHLVLSAAGLPPTLLEAAAVDARGLVIAGSGAGNVPSAWAPWVRSAVEAGVPVLLASRCEAGRVVPSYGGGGGGATLVAAGAVPVGALSAIKARVALAFALGAGRSAAEVPDLLH